MAIRTKDGRHQSRRTRKELEAMLQLDMKSLSADEREALEIVMKEMMGEIQVEGTSLVQVFDKAEFKRQPVDIETFVMDEYFLGKTCSNLYPQLMTDLKDMFSGGYHEVILTGSIGWGKCLRGDAEVFDTQSGRRRRVDELGKFKVATMRTQQADGSAAAQSCSEDAEAFESGEKPCLDLLLADGRKLGLSYDHPVLTPTGWVKASNVKLGDLIAVARTVPSPSTETVESDAAVKLVAHLLADGGCIAGNTFTNADPRLLDEVAQLTEELGTTRNGKQPGALNAKCSGSLVARRLSLSGLADFVRKYDLKRPGKDKRVPASFYGLPLSQVSLFLNRFWACDGSVSTAKPQKAEVTLASELMVKDIQFLLTRLGVQSRVLFKTKFYRDDSGNKHEFPAWCLTVTGARNLETFLDTVGPIYGKEEGCSELRSAISKIKHNTNTDIVPVGYNELREIAEELGKRRSTHLARKYGCPKGQQYGREKFQHLCEEYKYQGKYAWLATADVLWERVKSVTDIGVHKVYDLTVPTTGCFVANGIVVHNTHLAAIGAVRVLYELSCMKNPHKSFGLAPGTNIAMLCTSVTEAAAVKVAFDALAGKIQASPYFEENFKFEATKKEMRFPSNIWVAARASTDTAALGLNALSAFLDETNFFAKTAKDSKNPVVDKAESIYNTLKIRMKSRFERGGKLPGMIFVVSSKNSIDDFTAKRIRESKNDPTVFVRDYPLWGPKPDHYAKEKFWVLCGNETVHSKILTDQEYEEMKDTVAENVNLVHVPVNFRSDFERELEKAIRDLAGVATVAINPFINRREKITEAVDKTRVHPFTTLVYDSSQPGAFRWDLLTHRVSERGYGNAFQQVERPILNPRALRHVHIDPSLRNDSTGVCIAHVSGWMDVIRRGDDGKEFSERAPIYTVDLLLRVVPPTGGEIVLSELRHIVYEFTAHGYAIAGVTLDTWNSAEAIQTFNQRGYKSSVQSVDVNTEPYDCLKTALYENRVHYYEYEPLLIELQQLERVFDGRRAKVDHPPKGGKDVCDALAATVYCLSQRRSTQPLPILKGGSAGGDAWMAEQQQAGYAGNAGAKTNTTLPMPFLSGGDGDNNGGWGSGGGDGNEGGGWYPG